MRVGLIIYVNLDPTPGAFSTIESAQQNLQAVLDNLIPHYDPNVLKAPRDMQPASRNDYEGNNAA